jgi:hypothetical protein
VNPTVAGALRTGGDGQDLDLEWKQHTGSSTHMPINRKIGAVCQLACSRGSS